MASNWTTIDNSDCHYLRSDELCYHARIHVPGGYAESESNRLISNLKKPAATRGTNQWKYKVGAANTFAEELHDFLKPIGDRASLPLVFVPTSKCVADPEHDPRWTLVGNALKKLGDYRIETPVSVLESKPASSSGSGNSRNPDLFLGNFNWKGFTPPTFKGVVLIDDVITTGGHFTAMRRFIQGNLRREVGYYGVFWAKHQHTKASGFDFDISKLLG